MPSLMATSLRWRTHSARTKSCTVKLCIIQMLATPKSEISEDKGHPHHCQSQMEDYGDKAGKMEIEPQTK